MSRGTIILVEDESPLRSLYTKMLQDEGFIVFAAHNGKSAKQLIHTATKPKCIILDIGLPDISGVELCRLARAQVSVMVPIIFITGKDQIETLRDCMDAGGSDYILKSSTTKEILDRVCLWANKGQRANTTDRQKILDTITERLKMASLFAKPNTLTRQNDKVFNALCTFVDRARSAHSDNFGQSIEEKLYLLGYITGLTEFWSETESDSNVKERFNDYLKGLMKVTQILDEIEIDYMMASIDELNRSPLFIEAKKYGRHDCKEAKTKGEFYHMSGLAKFSEVKDSLS